MRISTIQPFHLASATLAALLVAMVGAMLVPLPTVLIDLLLVANLAAAITIVLVSVFAKDGLELSSLPTLLLVTTLLRLSLNISTTRLILLQANAGEVVQSFGDFVVRGNYVVGAVVFLAITLVQFIVIARGSERVAEVGARFALDAMPGKQMSIDAERRAGSISANEASRRGRRLQRESQFYGAMDGAMKFVKGDAIAGLVMISINLVGGLVVGVVMQKMPPLAALELYGLLTVGDGLVSQIPALLIATAAGIVVTRVSSENERHDLAQDLARQLFGDPKPMVLLAAFLAALAILPGLPWMPFLVGALVAAALAFVLSRSGGRSAHEEQAASESGESGETPIRIGLNEALMPQVAGALLSRVVPNLRRKLADTRGVQLPPVTLFPMSDPGFVVHLHGCPVSEGPATPGGAVDTVSDALSKVVHERADQLIDMQAVQELLDGAAQTHPAVVKAVVPSMITLAPLTELLRRLAREQIPIRPFVQILETIAEQDWNDVAVLAERVRQSLRGRFVPRLADDGVLHFHSIDPMIDDAVRDAVMTRDGKRVLAMAPQLAEEIVESLVAAKPSVLVVSEEARPFVRELLEPHRPEVVVLSYPELEPGLQLAQAGTITP